MDSTWITSPGGGRRDPTTADRPSPTSTGPGDNPVASPVTGSGLATPAGGPTSESYAVAPRSTFGDPLEPPLFHRRQLPDSSVLLSTSGLRITVAADLPDWIDAEVLSRFGAFVQSAIGLAEMVLDGEVRVTVPGASRRWCGRRKGVRR